jgi:hypothetical protein
MYKYYVIVDGQKYEHKSKKMTYRFVVIGKRVNADIESVCSYETPYGEQFCGKEVKYESFGSIWTYKCNIYSPQLDVPKLDAECRQKTKDTYPDREVIMEKIILHGSPPCIADKEKGYKDGEYGSMHCPEHAHVKYEYAVFHFSAKKTHPEPNLHKFVVISWHIRRDLAEKDLNEQRMRKLHSGENVWEDIQIMEIPSANITEK